MAANTNNARIAKNTVFLYLRMLLVLIVNLFTVRIVLRALGAEDYGLFNVVGGVVTMFSFLTGSLNSSSLRFFSYSLGQNDHFSLRRYFSNTFWCYVIFGALILLLAETVGLWFVQNKLTIPETRYEAALWVYQFAIFSFLLSILSVPYNSLLISHERMHIYAYVGVVEVLLKLAIAYLLLKLGGDKLKIYAILMCVSTGLVTFFYVLYDTSHFIETKLLIQLDIVTFKEILGFSAWIMVGAVADVCRVQGINIILNIFFGPIVNAARAIASQIESAISGFATNFYNAVRPQITKYYSSGDNKEMTTLVNRSTRLSIYLMLFLSLPVLFEVEFVLRIWLGDVPNHTVSFTRLAIIYSFVNTLSLPIQTTISATGQIKWPQIVISLFLVLNLPVSWVLLKMGYSPESTMCIAIVIAIVLQGVRMWYAKQLAGMPLREYVTDALIPIFIVSILCLIVPFVLSFLMTEGVVRFFVLSITTCLSSGLIILFCGMTRLERKKILFATWSKVKSIGHK